MEKLDKLIELLNEHEELAPSRIQRKYYQENWHIMYIDKEWEDIDDYRTDYEIISKSYWFIKWLVDNNKIDKSKYENILDRIEYYSQSEEEQERHYYSDYESLLMLLAISDTPIDDLISYLK